MDEEETKNCPNCKREIPAVNFTIHSVHCARNIRVCPVCKEPVPSAELDDHHKKFHKLLPCKQCGESVCGTDLEDHIRDSCANTIKTCRYCELELPRRELPAHEGYCGVRTEQCEECREWVMIKYKQLHVDSNHGFIRLDDDPPPPKDPSKLVLRPRQNMLSTGAGPVGNVPGPSLTNNPGPNFVLNARPNITGVQASAARPSSLFPNAGVGLTNVHNDFSRTQMGQPGSSNGSSGSASSGSPAEGESSVGRPLNGVKKRTNDQPQINTNKEVANKLVKDLPTSRGAVKKRVAPAPPRPVPADPRRDAAYYSALQRQQREERARREQNEYNLAHGLPPVLNPLAKIEKLRKMDVLQNRDLAEEYRNHQRRRSPELRDEERRRQEFKVRDVAEEYRNQQRRSPELRDEERRRQEFKNLKPMSPEQFLARFNQLQLRGDEAAGGDRFSEIKSSLRELRRGLNEVTAPYNNNSNPNNNIDRVRTPSPREEVRLPCEFCNVLVPADDLVQHQTGCRPDLARYQAQGPPSRPASPAPPPPRAPSPRALPLIPCEFCSAPLPVYLIAEHQERCASEVDMN